MSNVNEQELEFLPYRLSSHLENNVFKINLFWKLFHHQLEKRFLILAGLGLFLWFCIPEKNKVLSDPEICFKL